MKLQSTGNDARKVLEALRSRIDFSGDDSLEVWGPVESFQYDAAGIVPIQQYVTVLVRRNNCHWLFLRQVSRVTNGHRWPSPPVASKTSDVSARLWLMENGFSDEVLQPAPPSRSDRRRGHCLKP